MRVFNRPALNQAPVSIPEVPELFQKTAAECNAGSYS